MKKQLFFVSACLALGLSFTEAKAQAELQVIHNCADPAAATVDIYVNGTNVINDFEFRKATPFISLPSGVPLNIGVAPGNSTSVNDTLVNFTLTLNNGEKYVAIASGVLNPAAFAANPDGKNTAFGLNIITGAQSSALQSGNADIIVNHGSTDAPAVDVIARSVATLVDNAAYGDVAGYISVPASNYILDITPAADNSTIVASFSADLTPLSGGAAVVFASGFLDPSANQNGPAFGLYAALTDGTVLPLPATSQARIQVIHNAADPAAASVDIYINGTLTVPSFAFRTATPFIDIPAGVTLNIGIAPANSSSVNDTLANIPVTLENGKTYVAIANGVLAPGSFAANPDGRPTGFSLLLADDIRESALAAGTVDLVALHGSTDAPTVDVLARGVATLVNDAAYGDLTGYITVPASNYILDVTPGNDNSLIVASYGADLTALSGGAAVVFASGFLDPSTNQNGPAFGLYAALPNGTVVALPSVNQARLQVIHNAADPAAASVDVYVNGALTIPSFNFRAATPFIDIPAGVTINIGIAPANSTSVNDTLVNIPVVFENGETYVAIANGVLNPASFAANPDGRPTAFQLLLQDGIRESANNAGEVDFIAVHGATDAPTVDVKLTNGPVLVDNAAYTDITGYLNVPAAAYSLDVTPGNDNSVVVASYLADLSTLGGGAAIVFASGFLNPAANQNGEGFGLWVALPSGTTFPLPVTTGISENETESITGIYPNPANQGQVVTVTLNSEKMMTVEVLNNVGQMIFSEEMTSENDQIFIDTKNFSAGMYVLRTIANGKVSAEKLVVQ